MEFTDRQKQLLSEDLPRDCVRRLPDNDKIEYVAAFYVIDRANRVFGFDGWSYSVVEIDPLRDGPVTRKGSDGDYVRWQSVIRAVVEVDVGGLKRRDVGIGIADYPEKNAMQATELAYKAAATDALKRALRTFGMSFGLALYDKDRDFVGASTAAQSLLNDAKSLPAPQLAAWALQNADAIAKLHVDDRALVNACIAARQAEATVIELHDRIARATNEAELRSVLADAQTRGVDQATLQTLAARCTARKGQLVEIAAASRAVALEATKAQTTAPPAAAAPAPAAAPPATDTWGLAPPTVTVAPPPAAPSNDAAPWLARISAAQSVGEISAVLRDAQVAAVPSTVIQALVPKATERKLQLQNGARAA